METTRIGAKTLRKDYRRWKKIRRLMAKHSRRINRGK
jgi:hypothetical protein